MLKSTELRATVCSAKASFLLSPSFLKRSTSATAPLIVKGNNHGLSLCYSEAQTACFAICIAFSCDKGAQKKHRSRINLPRLKQNQCFQEAPHSQGAL